MLPGYNTNGFAHHRLEDALVVLSELGYRSVALTLDYHALDPYSPDYPAQRGRVREILRERGLRCVIETGARFLLDPRRKHQPTLLAADPAERARRAEFLGHAIDLAAFLGADAVSFWSGADPGPGAGAASEADPERWDRLAAGCRALARRAADAGVVLGFEPEPGMFIDTMARFEELLRRVEHPAFRLTLDVGHLHCLGETPVGEYVRRFAPLLCNIHIEDMVRGVHDHRMFGEGEMDFGEVLGALKAVGYGGGLHVELSRHSHDAVAVARRSIQFLNRWHG